MSLHRRMSSLLVCNVITGWLWASVNKTNAQSPLEKDRKKSHYCLRLTADCQVCSWIHYSDSFRLSRIDSYLFLNIFPPPPQPTSTGVSSPYHYCNVFHFISSARRTHVTPAAATITPCTTTRRRPGDAYLLRYSRGHEEESDGCDIFSSTPELSI